MKILRFFSTQDPKQIRIRRYIFFIFIIWTLLVVVSLFFFLSKNSNSIDMIAKNIARAHFNKDQAFRFWGVSHGGVYVPVTAKTPSNKNLSHIIDRDIEKPDGTKLTLMNPAYMMRQMMNEYSKLYGIRGRITSLKYLYEGNKPDEWEKKALKSFEQGIKEVLEYKEIDNRRYLRLMRPLIVKKSCLKCHGHQGYKVGDIRGGIGVSIPLESLYNISEQQKKINILGHIGVWLLVLIGIFFLSIRESSRLKKQKELEQNLMDSKGKLEERLRQGQKMEAIGNLAGGIAHDFNNMLGIIMGYTELNLNDLTDMDLVKKNLLHVMKASERAKDMVHQILTFSRNSEPYMEPVNVGKIIEETTVLLRASIPTTIDIKYNIENDMSLILGNISQLNQVIMNLCINAAHAMKDAGGMFEINLKEIVFDKDSSVIVDLEPGSYLHLTVRDTGTGISKEIINRIFEPYFTTKKDGEGTGMGLAVIYGIVKTHRGNINVYSEIEKGTIFNVYFPVLDTVITEELQTDQEIIFQGNKEMILLVDDEPPLVGIGTQMLKKLGYQVECRTSSVEALKVFKADPDKFDLIITDMTMPNMTGVELAEKIHKIKPDIPIILCTGFSTSINRNNFESKGISALIMKPLVKRELADAIRRVLDKRKK